MVKFGDRLYRFRNIYVNFEKIEHTGIGIFLCFICDQFEITFYKYKLTLLW